MAEKEVLTEQQTMKIGLLEEEAKDLKQANLRLELKTDAQSQPDSSTAMVVLRREEEDKASREQTAAELNEYIERYKAATRARAECVDENLGLKAQIVEIQMTVDDLTQKLKKERKLSADQQVGQLELTALQCT